MNMTLKSKIKTALHQAAKADHHQMVIAIIRVLEREWGHAVDSWFRDALLNMAAERRALNSVHRWDDSHWDLVAQQAARALSSQLQASNRRVSPRALRRQLDESTDADLAALLGITLPAEELRTVRAVVRLRLRDDIVQSYTTPISN
jgi:hypothetical protein